MKILMNGTYFLIWVPELCCAQCRQNEYRDIFYFDKQVAYGFFKEMNEHTKEGNGHGSR